MEIEIGDIYIRHSDKKVYRVKKIRDTRIVLEGEEDEGRLCTTDFWGLEQGYTRVNPKSA